MKTDHELLVEGCEHAHTSPASQARRRAVDVALGSTGATIPACSQSVPSVFPTYGTHTGNIRNSFVCFRDATSGDPSLLRAGQISAIFLHSRTEKDASRVIQPFLIIKQYVPLSQDHARKDPYRQFPSLSTELWSNLFLPQSTIIRSSDFLAHFASFVYVPEGIRETGVVVRCLDRS
ncbi:hypothetical protein C8Q72DRAFT_222825 [Fomitopsis betulina]|nr:hypothetical protein C8Q72DRAFT_222825 [Fomitopsis betulina]